MTKNKNLMTHPSVADTPKLADWYHPTLNKYDAETISSKSVVICSWICDKGHTFTRSPNTILKSSKPCTVCSPYRKVIAGINDLATTHPEVAKLFSKRNTDPLSSYSKGQKREALWICNYGHEYSREVYIQVRKESGCPICSGQRIEIGQNDLETFHPELKSMWSKNNPPMNSFSVYSAQFVEWVCSDGHVFKRRIFHQTKGNLLPCPDCPKPIPFEASVASYEILSKIWSSKNSIDPKFVKQQSHMIAKWDFNDCGHEVDLSVKHMNKRDGMCPECSYDGGSSQEEFLANLIKDRYSINIEQRVRILDGREIDIYIPTLKKGIEFNGENWHSDEKAIRGGFKSAEEMHLLKLDKAKEKDIDLIFIWAHDWRKHRDIILESLDRWILDDNDVTACFKRLSSIYDGAECSEC